MENRTYTMNSIKELVMENAAKLKREIDSCRDGQVVSIPTILPQECYPNSAKICFSSYQGEYASRRMYCVMVDRPVVYSGSNYYLTELFEKRIVIFDNWSGLEDFFILLPYTS